jgi:hypothetical protein
VLYFYNGGVINNLAGATWDMQNDAGFSQQSGADGTFNNAGTFQKTAGTGTTGLGGVTFANSGTVTINTGTLNLTNPSANSGSITVAPGALVSITGNFTEGATGVLTVQVGGTATSQFGRITVSSAATLAGTLTIVLVNGFTPSAGDQFTIITDASQSGTFDTVNSPGLGGGLAFHVTYDPKDVTLSVS